jgi:tripartite-type tricarboxylate transporter receptor subunit TctC
MPSLHRSARLTSVTAVCLSGLLLSACGGSSSETASPGSGTGGGTAAPAADPCAELKGKTVKLVVGFSPGGGYDTYSRLIAPTLGEKIGAEVVVENQPGAGGLKALNSLRTADGDGTTIGIMNGPGSGAASLAGAPGADFKLNDLSYIGRIAGDAQLVVTNGTGKYDTWEDVKKSTGFRWGATGPGASDFVTSSLLIDVFNLKDSKVISGFDGSSEVQLAMAQGNVDGATGQVDSRRSAVKSGEQQVVLTFDNDRSDVAPDTPTVLELDVDERQKKLLEAHLDLLNVGRPLIGPADMDADALTCLRGALAETAKDPELLAEAKESKRPLNFLSGEELDKAVADLLQAPPEYIKVLKASF